MSGGVLGGLDFRHLAPVNKNPAQERPGRIEYLFLTPEQSALEHVLNKAVEELPPGTRLRCKNPEVRTKEDGREYLYFPHMDYDERTPPGVVAADLMCRTAGQMCPVQEQCLVYALSLAPLVGVWGGKTFIDGTPVGITNNQEVPHG